MLLTAEVDYSNPEVGWWVYMLPFIGLIITVILLVLLFRSKWFKRFGKMMWSQAQMNVKGGKLYCKTCVKML